MEIHVLVKVKDRSGDGNCGFVTYERQVLYARKRLNLEVEIHYSADTRCDRLSGPGGKMGHWVGTRLKNSNKTAYKTT